MRYKHVFFDFDGTLCDTFEGIAVTLDDTFAHYGIDVDKALYPKYVGPPLSETFTEYFGVEKAYEAVEYFRDRYVGLGAICKSRLYDGIASLLKSLKQAGLGVHVATCKKQEEAEFLLQRFGVGQYIDIVSGLCYTKRESKRDVLAYGLKQTGARAEDCILAGDTIYDAEGARQVGMDCALCLWGFGDYGAIDCDNVVCRAASPQDIYRFVVTEER